MDPKLSISQMLTNIEYTVSGTDGKEWEVVVDDSWHRTGSGDTKFNTGLFGIGSHTAVLFIAGFQVATASYIEKEVIYEPDPVTPIPLPPPPPPPIPPGVIEVARVGTSCSILDQYSNGSYYAIRHDRNGMLTSYHKMDYSEILRQANDTTACFETPPPPPPTVEELAERIAGTESSIGAINSTISGIVSAIADIVIAAEEEAISWRAGLDFAISELRISLTEDIFNVVKNIATVTDILILQVSNLVTVQLPKVWTSLDDIISAAEEEATAWREAYDSIWNKLEDWLIERILVILVKGLDRDVREK